MRLAQVEVVESMSEIAAMADVSQSKVSKWSKQDEFPKPTASGKYIKSEVLDFIETAISKEHESACSGSARDEKLRLECKRIKVTTQIERVKLASEELKLAEQRKELMPVAEHKQKMVAAAQLYVTSIEQGIENASTQMRSAEMRAVLEKVFNAVRDRVANSLEV